MNDINLKKLDSEAIGDITLSGSKSISNRVLIIKALCKQAFTIQNLSTSDDTVTLQSLLASNSEVLDAHHAGTTFRFMTAYIATQTGNTRKLTGSERMQKRPIGPLVDALRTLGAEIQYDAAEGFPPLEIKGSQLLGGEVTIAAGISSQFISALLLIAPTLQKGQVLKLDGELVSRSYIMMTLRIMEYFGVSHTWVGDTITVARQDYVAKDFYVEADWSAASYFYSVAAISSKADITLRGLHKNSLQGDIAIAAICEKFGVQTTYFDDHINLQKNADAKAPDMIEYDFLLCPDIAQTVSVMCAATGTQGLFTGLKTLYIKETDRVAALQNELQKVGVFLTKLPEKFSAKSGITYHMQEGKAISTNLPSFATYKDHRMAMAFAPLALLFDIDIQDKDVVSKSYPNFWMDFKSLFS